MKFVACVMAFLIFASSFIDICINETEADGCEGTEQLSSIGDGEPELCSPFCPCASCTLSVIIPQRSAGNLILKPLVSYLSPLSEGAPVEMVLPFWQPPKLA